MRFILGVESWENMKRTKAQDLFLPKFNFTIDIVHIISNLIAAKFKSKQYKQNLKK